jgi:NADH:ubiquinone oxidoreductase subunit 4 (subunit M)
VLVIYYGVHPQPILDACAASVDHLLKSAAAAVSTKTAALGAL